MMVKFNFQSRICLATNYSTHRHILANSPHAGYFRVQTAAAGAAAVAANHESWDA